MNEFWKRQLDYLQALGLTLLMYCVAGLISGLAGGGKVHSIVLGMAMFQACLATVRAGK